jgi:uncharacterized phiE125 gp8 family phage protein
MAGWKVTTAPTETVISTSEAKAWLRVEHSDEDSLVAGLVAYAINAAQNYLSQAFVTQTITETFDTWENVILTVHPVQSITSIRYVDNDGATQTLASTKYKADLYAKRCKIMPAYNETWPTLRPESGAVEVVYVAGYGAASAVPEDIKTALKLMLADVYENRGDAVRQLPTASKYILDRINYTYLL